MGDEPLAVLADTERLIIRQHVELMEAAANAAANAIGFGALGALGETANKYDVFTDDGGKQFEVVETSELCGLTGRCCCRPNHKLQLHVYLPEYSREKEVMYLDRPCKCGSCCAVADICRQEMMVYEGDREDPGKLIAVIRQPILGGGLSPQLEIMERDGETVTATVTANAVCCIAGMCCDHTFTVEDRNGNYMGKLVKERPEGLGDIAKELATDADNFTMYVPKDADPKQKASMLATLHLIDYMFFENEGDLVCDLVNQKCSIKCCDMYCGGCICPCACTCDGSSDGDGDGGGDE